MRILTAARAYGLQAIDGPHLQIRDVDAFRRSAGRTAALGFDGKWVLHPLQVEAANEVYAPTQQDYDHAELILDAYEHATALDGRGAVMLGDEMLDEASRKVAMVVAGQGRAAGLRRTREFTPPTCGLGVGVLSPGSHPDTAAWRPWNPSRPYSWQMTTGRSVTPWNVPSNSRGTGFVRSRTGSRPLRPYTPNPST